MLALEQRDFAANRAQHQRRRAFVITTSAEYTDGAICARNEIGFRRETRDSRAE